MSVCLVSRKPSDCRLPGSDVKTQGSTHADSRLENWATLLKIHIFPLSFGLSWDNGPVNLSFYVVVHHLILEWNLTLKFVLREELVNSKHFISFLGAAASSGFSNLGLGQIFHQVVSPGLDRGRFSCVAEALIVGTRNLEMVSPHPTSPFCITLEIWFRKLVSKS